MNKKQPPQTRRAAVTIWTVMVVCDAAFMAVAVAVAPAFRELQNDRAQPLAWIALVVAVAWLIISRTLSRAVKPKPDSTPDSVGVTRTVIASAVNEGSALLAIVAWLVTGRPHAIVALVISLVGLLLAFPSASRWPSLCKSPEPEHPNPLVR